MVEIDLEAALKEVQDKTESEIEIETAIKWAGRACACYQLYNETDDTKWLLLAASYENETIEHAALAKDDADTLKQVCVEMDKYKSAEKVADQFDRRHMKLSKMFK